jgi:hypothetical protein
VLSRSSSQCAERCLLLVCQLVLQRVEQVPVAIHRDRARGPRALPVVWVFIVVALADTVNEIVQSIRFHVFDEPLGFNWVIVTLYVPALLVSTYLIVGELLRGRRTA